METDNKEKKPKKLKQYKKHFFYGGIVFALAAAFILVNGALLYQDKGQNNFSAAVADYLPYPAARVNKEMLSFEELNNNYKIVKYFQGNQLIDNENYQMEDSEIKAQVFTKLILNIVVEQLSNKYGVVVTNEDIDNELENIKSQLPEGDTLEKRMQTMYGISEASFIEKSLAPEILNIKLHEEYLANDEIDKDVKANIHDKEHQAHELLDRIRGGESFEEVAQAESDDTMTKDQGGDLGYFERGEMVPEFEEAAFSLEVGKVSDVIQTSYGYHIIKATDKKTEDGVEKVKASHILLKTEDTYQQWLDGQVAGASVNIFLRGFSWQEGQVVVK